MAPLEEAALTASAAPSQLSAKDAELELKVADDPSRMPVIGSVRASPGAETATLQSIAEGVDRKAEGRPASGDPLEESTDTQPEAKPALPVRGAVVADEPREKRVPTGKRKSERRLPGGSSKRVHQLAKELGVWSVVVVAQLKAMGHAKKVFSAVEAELLASLLEPSTLQAMREDSAELDRRAAKRKAYDRYFENYKLLECRGCRHYFRFPYGLAVYRDLIWDKLKTADELARCGDCRKLGSFKTLEEELQGLGPFEYQPPPPEYEPAVKYVPTKRGAT